jgi:DNA-binding response OmpR family regulator
MGDEQSLQSIPPTDGETSSISSRACVLLVEDDRSVRRYLEVALQRSGYKVITAIDGLEAMKLAMSSEIDAVVTDAIMPHLSGQQLARFLRSNPKLAHTPIILLTGQEDKQSAAAPNDLIDTFLYKPINTTQLIECLAKLIRGRHSNLARA